MDLDETISINLARRMAGRGYTVTPCQGKRPLFRDWQQGHSVDDVKWADCSVGVVTGNVAVIDCDSDEAINLVLDAAKVRTPIVSTPRGYHILFRWTDIVSAPTKVSALPSVDIRGRGGLAIVYHEWPSIDELEPLTMKDLVVWGLVRCVPREPNHLQRVVPSDQKYADWLAVTKVRSAVAGRRNATLYRESKRSPFTPAESLVDAAMCAGLDYEEAWDTVESARR